MLPIILAFPDALLGKAEVMMPPWAGLPLTLLVGSKAYSTSFRLISATDVMAVPREFLSLRVKPAVSEEMTGIKVTLTVILSFLFYAVIVGPPEPRAHRMVSSFQDEPDMKKL